MTHPGWDEVGRGMFVSLSFTAQIGTCVLILPSCSVQETSDGIKRVICPASVSLPGWSFLLCLESSLLWEKPADVNAPTPPGPLAGTLCMRDKTEALAVKMCFFLLGLLSHSCVSSPPLSILSSSWGRSVTPDMRHTTITHVSHPPIPSPLHHPLFSLMTFVFTEP